MVCCRFFKQFYRPLGFCKNLMGLSERLKAKKEYSANLPSLEFWLLVPGLFFFQIGFAAWKNWKTLGIQHSESVILQIIWTTTPIPFPFSIMAGADNDPNYLEYIELFHSEYWEIETFISLRIITTFYFISSCIKLCTTHM